MYELLIAISVLCTVLGALSAIKQWQYYAPDNWTERHHHRMNSVVMHFLWPWYFAGVFISFMLLSLYFWR